MASCRTAPVRQQGLHSTLDSAESLRTENERLNLAMRHLQERLDESQSSIRSWEQHAIAWGEEARKYQAQIKALRPLHSDADALGLSSVQPSWQGEKNLSAKPALATDIIQLISDVNDSQEACREVTKQCVEEHFASTSVEDLRKSYSTLVYRMAASRCMIKRLVRRISEDMAFPSSITNFLSTDEDFLEHKVQQILEDYVDKEHKIEPQREQEESEKLMETTNPTLRRSVNQTRACGPASMISFPSPRLSTIEINTAMSPITTTMSPAQVQIGALKMFVASLTTPFESISKSVNAAICESEVLQKDTVQGLSFYSGSETTSTNEQLPNVPSCDLGVVTHGCSPSSTLSPTTLLLSSKTGRTVGERIKSTITSRQTPTRLLHRRSSSPPILMGGNDDSVRSTVDSTNGSIERDHDEENDAKMHRQTIQQKCSLSEDVISFLKRTDETIKCIRQRGLALNEEVLPVVKQCNVLTLPSKHRRSFGVPTAEEASQEQGEAPLKISVNFQQVITTKMQQTPPPELLSQASRNSRQDEQRSSNVPSDTRKSYSGHEFGPYGLDLITFGPRSSIASSGWLHTPRQEGPQTPRNEGSHTSRREGSHTPREALTPRPRFRPKNVHSVVSVARPSIAASRRIDAQEICLPPGRPHQTYAYKFPHEFPHTLA